MGQSDVSQFSDFSKSVSEPDASSNHKPPSFRDFIEKDSHLAPAKGAPHAYMRTHPAPNARPVIGLSTESMSRTRAPNYLASLLPKYNQRMLLPARATHTPIARGIKGPEDFIGVSAPPVDRSTERP